MPHIYPILVKEIKFRDRLRDYLDEKNIQTGMHYFPNHLLNKFRSPYALPGAEHFYKRIITLPLHPDLSLSDVD